MKTILLDTNSYGYFIKGDKDIVKKVTNSEVVLISAISIGELYAGFQRGNRFEKNIEILNEFTNRENVKVAKVISETAKIYGKITCKLFKKGTPIPSNDIWIALEAIKHRLLKGQFWKRVWVLGVMP